MFNDKSISFEDHEDDGQIKVQVNAQLYVRVYLALAVLWMPSGCPVDAQWMPDLIPKWMLAYMLDWKFECMPNGRPGICPSGCHPRVLPLFPT